jgi:hypothetical protein
MAIDLVKWRRRLIYVHGDAILLTWLPKYLKFQRNLENPLRLQEKKLLAILQANKDTAFGKKYGFGEIQTIRQFQDRVPINDYESMKPYINRMIQGEKNVLTYQEPFFFSTTSGTTGEPKYIPITPDFEKEYNDRLWLFTFLRTYPCSGYFNSILAIVSQPSDEVTPGGIPCGSHSHRTYCRQSRLIRAIYALPPEVFAIDDWYARYYTILRLSVEKPVRILLATHPNSLLTLAQKADEVKDCLIRDVEKGTLEPGLPLPSSLRRPLERHLFPNPRRAARLRRSMVTSGGRLLPSAVWPTLEAIVCWIDGSARFYKSQLEEKYRLPIHNLGYLATEGRGSIPVTFDGTDVLAIHLHFFEFIPEDEILKRDKSVLTCDQIEKGKFYYILFTASNGLYRYFINDVVYVSGFYKKTPVIRFAFKGGNVSSLTGEKIYETHVENAMARAQRRIGATIVDYTAIPCLATPPFYRVAVEFPEPDQQRLKENLARELDRELLKENISYRRMRDARILGELEVAALPPGTFERFIKFRVNTEGAPYSQIKINHLNPGLSFLKFLESQSIIYDADS